MIRIGRTKLEEFATTMGSVLYVELLHASGERTSWALLTATGKPISTSGNRFVRIVKSSVASGELWEVLRRDPSAEELVALQTAYEQHNSKSSLQTTSSLAL